MCPAAQTGSTDAPGRACREPLLQIAAPCHTPSPPAAQCASQNRLWKHCSHVERTADILPPPHSSWTQQRKNLEGKNLSDSNSSCGIQLCNNTHSILSLPASQDKNEWAAVESRGLLGPWRLFRARAQLGVFLLSHQEAGLPASCGTPCHPGGALGKTPAGPNDRHERRGHAKAQGKE